ncbi:hypothetical protein QJS66_07255 [Kocuria rhizophila]|nr:hypothetical protein QJS66_07255 [Kocuria rhizophila]
MIEEKQSRVVEILLQQQSRVGDDGREGNAAMATGGGAAGRAPLPGCRSTAAALPLDGWAPILWFVMLFSIGFVMIAALYAAAASMVSRQEDIGSPSMPVTAADHAPTSARIFFNDNPASAHHELDPVLAPAWPCRYASSPGPGRVVETNGSLVLLIVTTALAIGSPRRLTTLHPTGKALSGGGPEGWPGHRSRTPVPQQAGPAREGLARLPRWQAATQRHPGGPCGETPARPTAASRQTA